MNSNVYDKHRASAPDRYVITAAKALKLVIVCNQGDGNKEITSLSTHPKARSFCAAPSALRNFHEIDTQAYQGHICRSKIGAVGVSKHNAVQGRVKLQTQVGPGGAWDMEHLIAYYLLRCNFVP